MASGLEGNAKGKGVAPVTDYGLRAAAALNDLIPGPHRDKAVARLFNCSVRFAKYLRAGQHWTADRLSQASRVLGADFDIRLNGIPVFQVPTTPQLHERIDALEAEFRALQQHLKTGGGDNAQ